MQIFAGLLEGEALSCYLGTSLSFWEELETEFVQTWCVYMSSTTAIVEAAKVYLKEHKKISECMLKNLKNCIVSLEVISGGFSCWIVPK